MISPIDNLIKMFFKWKVDMLANITLASIAQCMKFKLFYDDWVRTHPLKRSNQPVITSFNAFNNNNNNNKNKIVKENNNNSFEIDEYRDDVEISEEEDNGISIDFTSTFSKYFDSNELRNQEEEITLNFQKLNVESEVYISPLSPDELLHLTYNHFEITRSYMWSKTKSYYCQDKRAN
jgi:ribosome-interacting GTPase 1